MLDISKDIKIFDILRYRGQHESSSRSSAIMGDEPIWEEFESEVKGDDEEDEAQETEAPPAVMEQRLLAAIRGGRGGSLAAMNHIQDDSTQYQVRLWAKP